LVGMSQYRDVASPAPWRGSPVPGVQLRFRLV
jgi:hypothetical protein